MKLLTNWLELNAVLLGLYQADFMIRFYLNTIKKQFDAFAKDTVQFSEHTHCFEDNVLVQKGMRLLN